jgi:pimeloyl-ACP methyl ester carboxylesterase/tetratricopeptide (TPR) repeat protein
MKSSYPFDLSGHVPVSSLSRYLNPLIAQARPGIGFVMALVVWLAAAGAGADAVPVPGQAELLRLIRAQMDHAALAPDVRAGTPRPGANLPPLGKADAEAWRHALWTAWVEQVKETRSPQQIELGDPWTTGKGIVAATWWPASGKKQALVMRYFTRVFGQKPEGGWPLYINLHAGGNNQANNDRCWVLTRTQYAIGTGLYLCPRSLRDLAESWYDPVNYPLLDRILAEAMALWDVNPDKIYLMGFSMGGWGVMHLAPTLPDRWAAVSASSGAGFVGATGRSQPDNLRNTPILIQSGGTDIDFGRLPLSRAFAAALKGFHERDTAGYEVVFKEHAGQGHQIKDGDAPGWLARHTREPLPTRIVWQQPFPTAGNSKENIDKLNARDWGTAAHYARQAGWLRNEQPGAYQRIVANRDGNTVTIEEADHVGEVVILLNDRMADLDQPVRVLCGGKELASVTPKRTVDALIASLIARGDRQMMFSAELVVKPVDTTAALEGKDLTTAADLLRRSRYRQAKGRFAEALDDLDAAVKLDPARGLDGGFKEMQTLAATLKDVPRSAEIVRRWADADAGNANLQQQAAQFLLGDNPNLPIDAVAGLRFAERAVAAQPANPRFLQTLGFAQHANGKAEESVATIRKAMDLLPAKGSEEQRKRMEMIVKAFEGKAEASDTPQASTPKSSAIPLPDPSATNPPAAGKPASEVARDTLSRQLDRAKFVIHTDLSEVQAKHYAAFFEGFYTYFSTNYFPLAQPQKLNMLLFSKTADYEAFHAPGKPPSPFGYYQPARNTLVVNVERGLGTATHELVHHFLTIGKMDHHPHWINEGIPMFFEKFMGYVSDEGALNISFGYFSNWRFPVAKEKIETYTLSRLIEEEEPCLASSFMLFLHTKGHMRRFVQQLHVQGKNAKPAELLVAVYGQPLDTIEREWKAWVAGQPIDGNVNLVPSSFVKTASEWRAWWQENKERLVWDETRGIYRIR